VGFLDFILFYFFVKKKKNENGRKKKKLQTKMKINHILVLFICIYIYFK
jgi:hypothetical protein